MRRSLEQWHGRASLRVRNFVNVSPRKHMFRCSPASPVRLRIPSISMFANEKEPRTASPPFPSRSRDVRGSWLDQIEARAMSFPRRRTRPSLVTSPSSGS